MTRNVVRAVRAQVEDTGEEALDEAARRMIDAGAEVEKRMVFTPDEVETVDRLAREEGSDALLLFGSRLEKLDRILVILQGTERPDRVADPVADLDPASSSRFTLLHVSDEQADEGRALSDEVLARLTDRELDTVPLESRVETSAEPDRSVLSECRTDELDSVVIPQTSGSVGEHLIGEFSERIAREADLPVLLVRQEDEAG